MPQVFTGTGTVENGSVVRLDEPLPSISGRVRITGEALPVTPEKKPDLQSFMEKMWEEQRKRGHIPRTHEQVIADLTAERDSGDN